jgi:hypothetical protein
MTAAPRRERPTIEQLREVCQPPVIRGRRTAEHWIGDLYQRRISLHVTRVLLRLGLSANQVTMLMILSGWGGAAVLLVPGIAGGVLCAVLVQLQMQWDASDGEVARWRGTSGPYGIFLDKVGHYTTEAFIPIALGIRAAGGIDAVRSGEHYGWTTLGALLAVGIVLNKALNDMVHVARAHSGLDKLADDAATAAPRPGLVARLRRVARFVPFHRLYHSVELSLLALAAAIVDAVIGGVDATRVLTAGLCVTIVLSVVGHFAVISASQKLRAGR